MSLGFDIWIFIERITAHADEQWLNTYLLVFKLIAIIICKNERLWKLIGPNVVIYSMTN